jgi:hypothetical protein
VKLRIKILFFILFFAPLSVGAEIIISEIAWMGTVNSANEEWIELQNTGSGSVSLTGWGIYKAGGDTLIRSLSGSISPGQYLLVCRTTPSITNPLSGICDITGTFGGGALNNNGEHIILKDGTGLSIQNLNFSSGWPAGNNSTKETMQWNGSIWITAEPTPGAPNAMFDSGSAGNQGTGGQTGGQADNGNNDEDEEDSYTIVNNKIRYDKEAIEIRVENDNVPVATPVKFSLWTRDLEGANIIRGKFLWNMGDGTEFVLDRNEKFEHFYEYEGSYVVSVEYYSTFFEGIEPNATHRTTVNVSNPAITISKIHPDGGVEIRNNSGREIDLSGWSLIENTGKRFTIPNRTFILAGRSIVFNPKQTKLNPLNVMLMNPMNKFVGSKEKFEAITLPPPSHTSSQSQTQTPTASESVNSEEAATLNEIYTANASAAKQKGLSLWIILFAAMVVGVSIIVFFVYKKGVKEETEEDSIDEFELLD